MKYIVVLFIIFALSCSNNDEAKVKIKEDSLLLNTTPAFQILASELSHLKKAIQTNDVNALTNYFNFPVPATSNIWVLVSANSDLPLEDKTENFIIEDLKMNLSNVFPPAFIKAMNSLNTNQLQPGNHITSDSIVMSNSVYIMEAEWDNKSNLLMLMLYSETVIESAPDEPFVAESAIMYVFKIDAKGKLKFERVDFAG